MKKAVLIILFILTSISLIIGTIKFKEYMDMPKDENGLKEINKKIEEVEKEIENKKKELDEIKENKKEEIKTVEQWQEKIKEIKSYI